MYGTLIFCTGILWQLIRLFLLIVALDVSLQHCIFLFYISSLCIRTWVCLKEIPRRVLTRLAALCFWTVYWNRHHFCITEYMHFCIIIPKLLCVHPQVSHTSFSPPCIYIFCEFIMNCQKLGWKSSFFGVLLPCTIICVFFHYSRTQN